MRHRESSNALRRWSDVEKMAPPGAVCDLVGGSTALISTTYYRYNDIGNVERVITEKANPQGEPRYSSVWLKYAKNGEAVSYVIGETWDDDCANTYEITYAREFRYDGARQRYLNRQLDPAALEAGNVVALNETWTDYDGDAAYADYTVSGSTLTQTALYEPGLARSFDPTNPAATQYYHTDQIGTTRLMTDTPGAGVSPNVVSESSFTAFGEQIGGSSQRYGYAGEWGYQTDRATDGRPFLHVGARYYDPTTGRFLQRDPIGILGGSNVYTYVDNAPTVAIDPSGLTKGGKQNIVPSDRPSNWDKLSTKEQQEVINDKIKNSKSPAHRKKWEGYKKVWHRNKIKKAFKPPWWARIGQYIPAPARRNVPKWQIGIAAVGCAPLVIAVVATNPELIPVATGTLAPAMP